MLLNYCKLKNANVDHKTIEKRLWWRNHHRIEHVNKKRKLIINFFYPNIQTQRSRFRNKNSWFDVWKLLVTSCNFKCLEEYRQGVWLSKIVASSRLIVGRWKMKKIKLTKEKLFLWNFFRGRRLQFLKI